jgi:hypothetical protein
MMDGVQRKGKECVGWVGVFDVRLGDFGRTVDGCTAREVGMGLLRTGWLNFEAIASI